MDGRKMIVGMPPAGIPNCGDLPEAQCQKKRDKYVFAGKSLAQWELHFSEPTSLMLIVTFVSGAGCQIRSLIPNQSVSLEARLVPEPLHACTKSACA